MRRFLFASVLIPLAAAPPAGAEEVDAEIVITTVEGRMVYDRATFSVAPGSKLKLTLVNPDNLQHNLVICHPGPEGRNDGGQEVADAAMALETKGFELSYIPPDHPRILAHTKMVDPKKSETIHVDIPGVEGEYPYVCTFPGHSLLMKGTMIVGAPAGAAGGLRGLSFKAYKGEWDKLPDFDQLEPAKSGALAEGLVDVRAAEAKDSFGLVFEGTLPVAKAGEYTFHLGSDDGSRLWIDDKEVVAVDGIHPMTMKTGKAKLAAGDHALKLAYFERGGEEELYLGYAGPGVKETNLSTGKKRGGGKGPAKGYPILPQNGEAVMYRNFIEGGGPRAIGVGLPEGLHYCWDANQMRLAMIWQGGFMDGARHWNGRGQGFQPPDGERVVAFGEGAVLAALPAADAPWSKEMNEGQPNNRPAGFRFRGYRLDKQRRPSFRYTFGDWEVTDFTTVATPGKRELARTITITGPKPAQPLYYRVVTKGAGDGVVATNCEDAVRTDQDLRVPVRWRGDTGTVELVYSWKE